MTSKTLILYYEKLPFELQCIIAQYLDYESLDNLDIACTGITQQHMAAIIQDRVRFGDNIASEYIFNKIHKSFSDNNVEAVKYFVNRYYIPHTYFSYDIYCRKIGWWFSYTFVKSDELFKYMIDTFLIHYESPKNIIHIIMHCKYVDSIAIVKHVMQKQGWDKAITNNNCKDYICIAAFYYQHRDKLFKYVFDELDISPVKYVYDFAYNYDFNIINKYLEVKNISGLRYLVNLFEKYDYNNHDRQ